VWITTSDTTLSETIFSIVPGKRFRMLVLIIALFYGSTSIAIIIPLSSCFTTWQ
jgi:hypothetical protein